MSMKNVIKRFGVVFIVGPIWIICLLLNLIMWGTALIWGVIYYIITGNCPFDIEITPINIAKNFTDWYIKRFNLDETKV